MDSRNTNILNSFILKLTTGRTGKSKAPVCIAAPVNAPDVRIALLRRRIGIKVEIKK